MSQLIEEKKPEVYYELPEIDLSRNLDETHLTSEQFEKRFAITATHLKWSEDEAKQYHTYLQSLNHIGKYNNEESKNDEDLDFSMSLHNDYPTEHLSQNIKVAQGHPYIVRKPRKIEESGVDIITEDEIVDALYDYRVTKDPTHMESIIDQDLQGLLFEEKATLRYLNFPDESHEITCLPGTRVNLVDKHNKTIKALHWGQRKLILSEIKFITRVIHELKLDINDKSVRLPFIYPGAAPGTHFMLLMEMFPQLDLYLWDPAIFIDNLLYTDVYRRTGDIEDVPAECREFVEKYQGRVFICPDMVGEKWDEYFHNVTTQQKEKNLEPGLGFFNDSSLKWIHENIDIDNAMFISDIRLFTNNDVLRYQHIMCKYIHDPILTFLSTYDAADDYTRDMTLQKEWYNKSGIRFGLFKFKLDRMNKIGASIYQEYPRGEIMLQSWAPYSSTESRLFVDKQSATPAYYNVTMYEDMMKYFNNNVRRAELANEQLFKHGIIVFEDEDRPDESKLTLEHVWRIIFTESADRIGMDCLIETKIIYDFLKLYKEEISIFDIIHVISDITKSLKLKTPIRFSIKMDYHQSRSIIKKRSHFAQFFQRRLDYTSIRTDITPFPYMDRVKQVTDDKK